MADIRQRHGTPSRDRPNYVNYPILGLSEFAKGRQEAERQRQAQELERQQQLLRRQRQSPRLGM